MNEPILLSFLLPGFRVVPWRIMDPAIWKTLKETFSQALELAPAQREGFLANLSPEIRGEIEKLLSTYQEAQTFIDTPLVVQKGLRPNGREENLIGKLVDNYQIIEKLGEGGMGAVFLAERRAGDFTQRVALKLIKRGMDTNAVLKRFLMERQILAGLEHPNIARLFDGGSTRDGVPYFVMEYVKGESIRDFCENRNLDTNQRLKLFTKVCAAISYAHQQLIVHRDIKPSNIIVTESGEPKLLDFGIAKLLSPDRPDSNAERTATQFHVMTPDYASPEQLCGRMTTTSTDVYSLGVVLYELLTGTRPFRFKDKGPIEISEAILSQEPLRPSDCEPRTVADGRQEVTASDRKNPHTSANRSRSSMTSIRSLRGDLDNIVLQAIRREPERRYQSVVELSDDIHRYLDGLPVKATADTPLYHVGKFVRRHRAMVTGTVAFILLLLVSISLITRQYFVARAERAKSEQRLNELRSVAKSLMTETNAALKKMPQGLPIRKSVVEKSIAVLDSLAAEQSNDVNFLNELADDYDELGKMRFWSFHQSRLALSDYQKALQLRRRAAALAPDDIKLLNKFAETLPNMAEVYSALADREGLLRVWQEQRGNDLVRLQLDANNSETFNSASVHREELADALQMFGRTEESAAALQESFDLAEQSISLQQAKPFSLQGQVLLVAFAMQKGELLHRWQKLDEALDVYQAAADLAVQTWQADDAPQFAFNHASRIHRYMANIYAEKGDWQKYLECSEFSVNWIRDNRERLYRRGTGSPTAETYYLLREGVGLSKLGQKQAAIEKLDEGMKLFRQALQEHAFHGEDILYAPEELETATEGYVETDQDDKAVNLWEDYAHLIEPFVESNPDDTTSLNLLAYALDRKGDVFARYQKDGEAFGQTDFSRLRAALASYHESDVKRQRMLELDGINQSVIQSDIDAQKTLAVKISRLSEKLN